MAKPSKVSKFFKTLFVLLLILIVAITVVINVLFMKSSSAPFNNSIYIMQQFDMNDVQYGDAVISSANKVSELQPGNVVLCLTSFDNEYKEVLKLIDITQEDGTTYYYVKSDEESNEDALKLTQDKILAKCLWTNSTLGSAIMFAKSTLGIGILIALPCLILLILKIASTVVNQKELEKEEELRKNNKKNKKRKSHTEEIPTVKSNSVDSTEKKSSNKKSKDNNSKLDADEFFNKPVNKTIPVRTLSEEESVKQRENVSNIVGSELESATIEIKNGINKDNIKVSPASHIDMVKIDEEPIIEESVHSPNMIAKANKIRQSLSNNDSKSVENTSVVESKPVKNTSVVESKPVENTSVVESKSVENTSVVESKPVKNTFVVESKPVENTSVTEIDTDKPVIFNNDSPVDISKNTLFDEDDFLSDIIGNSKEEFSSSSKVSDDILDQLLSSIPSKTSVELPKKSAVAVVEKPVVRKSVSKTVRHSTTKTTTTKRHKSNNKVKDNTSFDELLKAIEKEKNGLK